MKKNIRDEKGLTMIRNYDIMDSMINIDKINTYTSVSIEKEQIKEILE